MIINTEHKNLLFWTFIILSIVVGFYFRIKGLGAWPLAVDEYYVVKSSENILKYGFPMWDAGGYYARGLPQQYLTAFLLFLGLKTEFASRIIPVFASLLAFPALYLIGKKISGRTFAAALIFLFAFSVWQVEFARFARMYSLFQTMFVWYLYFLIKFVLDGNRKSLIWLWVISFFSIFVYEASIFLVIINFFPLLGNNNKSIFIPFSRINFRGNFYKFFITILLFLIAYAFLSFGFRTYGQQNLLPPDIIDYFNSASSNGNFRLPIFLLSSVPEDGLWLGIFLVLLVFNLFILLKTFRAEHSFLSKISSVFLIAFSLLNLIGLVFISLIVFLLLRWIHIDELKFGRRNYSSDEKPKFIPFSFFNILILTFVINFLYWLVFSISSTVWYGLFPKAEITNQLLALKVMVKEAINYPYFYETFALFRDTLPIATYLNIFLIAFLTLNLILKHNEQNFGVHRFLVFIFLILTVLQNILNLTYFDSRYFFFLYPLVMILILMSIEEIVNYIIEDRSKKIIGFIFSIILINFLSEDYQPNHLVNIDSEEVNFRKGLSYQLTVHYYPRFDCRTPAQIVNKEASQHDLIIINEQFMEYYLNRVDYVFRDYKGRDFMGESVLEGTRERWTNANLIYKYDSLENIIDSSKNTVWLVLNSMWSLDELNALVKKYEPYLYSTGLDGKTLLFKILKS